MTARSARRDGPAAGPPGGLRAATLLGVMLGVAGIGNSTAALSLIPIADDLSVSAGNAAWSISLYALALAVCTSIYGRATDLYGPRRPYVTGVALMVLGSAISAAASSFGVHLGGRLVQGIGSAAMSTLGLAVISARYGGPFSGGGRLRALVTFSTVGLATGSLGPLVGGALVDSAGWRVALLLPAVGLLVVPLLWEDLAGEASGANMDVVGAVLVGLATIGVVLVIQSPTGGPGVAAAGAGLVVVFSPLLAVWTRRHPEGFLPASVVGNLRVLGHSLASSCIPLAWYACIVAIPAVLVGSGRSYFEVGLVLLPSAVIGLFFSGPVSRLGSRLGSRISLALAIVIAATALALAALGAETRSTVVMVLVMFPVTASFALGQPALAGLVADSVEPEVRGGAIGLSTLIFLMGGGVGPAVVGGIGYSVSLTFSLLLMAGVAALAAAAVLLRP